MKNCYNTYLDILHDNNLILALENETFVLRYTLGVLKLILILNCLRTTKKQC